MKKGKLAILLAIASVLAGGVIIASQKQNIFSNDTQPSKQLSTREKQLAYLREHEKDMVDFVKSLSPKVESVQIAWDETQWDEIGNGTPQGGGEILMVYGGFNHIQNSSWSVLVYLKDTENGDTDSVEGIGSGGPLRVEGKLFDE